MLSAVQSAAVHGVESYTVIVEVDSSPGLPHFAIVGLPAGAIKESRDRVGAALTNSGFLLPSRRITINLAPANVRKDGTAFDLPIALGVLAATGQMRSGVKAMNGTVFMGELGLDGALRPVRGVLSVARSLSQGDTLVVAPANAGEALVAGRARVVAPAFLRELVNQLERGVLNAAEGQTRPRQSGAGVDFANVTGQRAAKRALEIAAAGGHAVLMTGPPGSGKTMLARRLPTILPPLTDEEALEVLTIHSVAGLLTEGCGALPERPFRAPHHTVSAIGLVGGGSPPRPGEVSLAHHGVLFLDEMLEFPRYVLDAMRQPLEDGRIVVSRASGNVTFPSRFALVGAMNPCLCGRAGGAARSECVCSAISVQRYRSRLSGPMRDRIDLMVNVNAVPLGELSALNEAETSETIRKRVEVAHQLQLKRYSGDREVRCNAHAAGHWLRLHAPVDAEARRLLTEAANRLDLSARGYHRVLKVALTIGDLAGSGAVTRSSVAEALQYR